MPLPRGAGPPYEVYLNGVLQSEGSDYRLLGGELVFSRPIYKEQRVGFWRWLAMWAGLFGSYGRNETVDVQFRRDGRTELASDLKVLPDDAGQ